MRFLQIQAFIFPIYNLIWILKERAFRSNKQLKGPPSTLLWVFVIYTKLKEFYSEHPYTHHLESIINISSCLLYCLFVHPRDEMFSIRSDWLSKGEKLLMESLSILLLWTRFSSSLGCVWSKYWFRSIYLSSRILPVLWRGQRAALWRQEEEYEVMWVIRAGQAPGTPLASARTAWHYLFYILGFHVFSEGKGNYVTESIFKTPG